MIIPMYVGCKVHSCESNKQVEMTIEMGFPMGMGMPWIFRGNKTRIK